MLSNARIEVDVVYHAQLPVLSDANSVGHGKPPKGCIVFNPAYIPASPPNLNTSGLLVRMCCGPSCAGHGVSATGTGSRTSFERGPSRERIGFAPCDLITGVCQDVLLDFNLDPTVDTEDPRAFVYDGYYYNFYYRGAPLPGTNCTGSQCTVALAKTQTPLDAASWKPLATLPWHRNGCCIMRPRGQKSYCMWGEGPSPFPGLGISYTTDIDGGNFTQVPWVSPNNQTAPVTADSMYMLPIAQEFEVKLEAGTHMVELSSGNLLTFYAAATPGWVPNGNYTVCVPTLQPAAFFGVDATTHKCLCAYIRMHVYEWRWYRLDIMVALHPGRQAWQHFRAKDCIDLKQIWYALCLFCVCTTGWMALVGRSRPNSHSSTQPRTRANPDLPLRNSL